MNIKIQLMQLGMNQNDLIPELRKKGIKTEPGELSKALNDDIYETRPKWKEIRKLSAEIVEEWRKQEE